MTGRARLPDRRINRTCALTWPPGSGTLYTFTVGFDRLGRVRELFLDGHKTGSQLEALLDDACVLASRCLQYGEGAGELAGSLAREGLVQAPAPIDDDTARSWRSGPAASVLGQALQIAAALEAQEGPDVAGAHRALGEVAAAPEVEGDTP